jgi:hypothetical protein
VLWLWRRQGVVESAAAQLKKVLADKPRYKALLESLLAQVHCGGAVSYPPQPTHQWPTPFVNAQSLCQLLEPEVTVRVCKGDVDLVKVRPQHCLVRPGPLAPSGPPEHWPGHSPC